jgi:hypothetical protein
VSAAGAPRSPSAAFRVTYDAALVEESVLLAERRLPAADAGAFRAERNRIYGAEDPDEREARFEELHGRVFLRLGLDRPLHEALAGRPDLLLRASGCRVLPAARRDEEMADLCAALDGRPGSTPTMVVRLRPQSLLDPEPLRSWLRRELLHVADMLDPEFGYRRELPDVETDPALLSLLRERYRVVWDTTVDGRLCRQGGLDSRARAVRRAEFGRCFPTLGTGTEKAFASWFDEPRPRHTAIVAFIQGPRRPTAHEPGGRLPTGE